MDRQVLALEVGSLTGGSSRTGKSAVPLTRRKPRLSSLTPAPDAQFQGPASKIMRDILRSAADVLDADQAFILISRDHEPAETAAVLDLRPSKPLNLALRRAARLIQGSLDRQCVTAIDSRGHELLLCNGEFAGDLSPSVLCLPLEPSTHLSGVMCMIRRRGARRLTALDLEIVYALAEQAALAVGAASHQRALHRLEASLSLLLPAAN